MASACRGSRNATRVAVLSIFGSVSACTKVSAMTVSATTGRVGNSSCGAGSMVFCSLTTGLTAFRAVGFLTVVFFVNRWSSSKSTMRVRFLSLLSCVAGVSTLRFLAGMSITSSKRSPWFCKCGLALSISSCVTPKFRLMRYNPMLRSTV